MTQKEIFEQELQLLQHSSCVGSPSELFEKWEAALNEARREGAQAFCKERLGHRGAPVDGTLPWKCIFCGFTLPTEN